MSNYMKSENNILKESIDKKTENSTTEEQRLKKSTESKEDLNEETNKEIKKLEKNYEELQNDINEFGSEKEFEDSLKENPGIAKRLFTRAAIIMPMLIAATGVFTGSLAEDLQSGDLKGLAVTMFKIAAASGAISAALEGLKSLNKPKINKFADTEDRYKA